MPKKRKPHIFERLTNPGELEHAWRDVLAHYPKDRIPADLREFDRKREGEIRRLASDLRSNFFIPQPPSLIFIPKPTRPEEQRPITLIRPEDRIVLTALNRLLTPFFDRRWLPYSYAYRPGKGAWAAIERVTHCLGQSLVHIASGDIDEFFPNVDRERLLASFRRVIYEQPIVDLLETYLHIGIVARLEWSDTGRGIAQGSPLSPLLSNLALAGFDAFLCGLGVEWIRYADNFILLGQEPVQVRDAFARAEAFLLESCSLHLNPESRVFASEKDGFEFLGFFFREGRRSMSARKLNEKRSRISDIFRKNAVNLKEIIRELNETAEGWRAYYGKSPDTREQLLMLEQHIADVFQPWLIRFRSEGAGKDVSAAELKSSLLDVKLPITNDPRKKLKWAELLVARSRPGREQKPARGLSPAARRAIEQRKKEYDKLKLERQEIIVTKPGTYLGRTGERILIRNHGKREAEIPLAMVRNITVLTKAVSLSGDLMSEVAARGINIVLAGSDGRPLVRVGAPEFAEHQLSLLQSTLAASAQGLELARTIVAGKIRNQGNLLRYYLKYPERRSDGDFLSAGNTALQEMETFRDSVLRRSFGDDPDLERNRLFAAEGQAAVSYWSAVRCLLWWKPGFDGRVRRGANDLVNSLLNYGYGILYSRLMNVLVRAGLNVYVGFLHKPQKGKAGLLYDFIEEFRAAAVDRAVFGLLNLGIEAKILADGLDPETRRELARRVVERLQANTRYHGEAMPLERVAEQQAQLLVRHLEGKEPYKTWVLPW
jgi:CRISPR-associated endonuclease Cas1/group II intron reverse transcriptase/maturase